MTERTRVRCYSGHTYAQEPQSFLWQGTEHIVTRVRSVRRQLERTSGQVLDVFLVETTGDAVFRLAYDDTQDRWTVANLP